LESLPGWEIIMGFQFENLVLNNIDMAAKRHKKHKNKISHLIISIGCEIEIQ
jgi:hypothetical protein